MASLRRLGVGLCAAILASASPALAQLGVTRVVGDISVVVEAPIELDVARGYAPVTLRARNDGAESEKLSLRFGRSWTSEMAEFSHSQSLTLGPGQQVALELLIAVDRGLGARGDGRLLFSSGREISDVRLPFRDGGADPLGRVIGLVGATELSEVELATFVGALPLGGPERGRGIFDVGTSGRLHYTSRAVGGTTATNQAAQVFTLPFDGLPSRTASWSSVDTLLVRTDGPLPGGDEWQGVLDWVRMGGQLAFVGTADPAALRGYVERSEWARPLIQERLRIDLEPSPEGPSVTAFRSGLGSVALISGAEASGSGATSPLLGDREFLVRLFTQLDQTAFDGEDHGSFLSQVYRATYHDGSGVRGFSAPWETPFPEDKLPIRPILAFLFVFSILVGPLSVRMARKRNNPSFLFVSVPVISLIATALVVGFGLFRQGFGISGFAHSLAIVDQVEAQSTTVLRREMVVGRGGEALEPLPYTVVLVPDHGEDRGARVLTEEGNQMRLSGNFLPVRARTDHLSFSMQSARARLEWKVAPDGAVRVTNMLGVDLTGLELKTPGGEIYRSPGPVDAGGSEVLELAEASRIQEELGAAKDPLFQAAVLPNCGYLATAASAGPGADDGAVKMTEELGMHAIVGHLDDSPERWGGR